MPSGSSRCGLGSRVRNRLELDPTWSQVETEAKHKSTQFQEVCNDCCSKRNEIRDDRQNSH